MTNSKFLELLKTKKLTKNDLLEEFSQYDQTVSFYDQKVKLSDILFDPDIILDSKSNSSEIKLSETERDIINAHIERMRYKDEIIKEFDSKEILKSFGDLDIEHYQISTELLLRKLININKSEFHIIKDSDKKTVVVITSDNFSKIIKAVGSVSSIFEKMAVSKTTLAKSILKIGLIASMTILVSCGSKGGSSSGPNPQKTPEQCLQEVCNGESSQTGQGSSVADIVNNTIDQVDEVSANQGNPDSGSNTNISIPTGDNISNNDAIEPPTANPVSPEVNEESPSNNQDNVVVDSNEPIDEDEMIDHIVDNGVDQIIEVIDEDLDVTDDEALENIYKYLDERTLSCFVIEKEDKSDSKDNNKGKKDDKNKDKKDGKEKGDKKEDDNKKGKNKHHDETRKKIEEFKKTFKDSGSLYSLIKAGKFKGDTKDLARLLNKIAEKNNGCKKVRKIIHKVGLK